MLRKILSNGHNTSAQRTQDSREDRTLNVIDKRIHIFSIPDTPSLAQWNCIPLHLKRRKDNT